MNENGFVDCLLQQSRKLKCSVKSVCHFSTELTKFMECDESGPFNVNSFKRSKKSRHEFNNKLNVVEKVLNDNFWNVMRESCWLKAIFCYGKGRKGSQDKNWKTREVSEEGWSTKWWSTLRWFLRAFFSDNSYSVIIFV